MKLRRLTTAALALAMFSSLILPLAGCASEEEEDNNDPYGEFIDFPEECRAKDPCQNMYRETLF